MSELHAFAQLTNCADERVQSRPLIATSRSSTPRANKQARTTHRHAANPHFPSHVRPHLDQIRNRFWNSKATITKDYKKRLWSYIPGAHQTLLIFVAYQVKNLYDTFIWDDGVEFIVHHVFSFIAGWGSMYPGAGHTYALFYMGVSEISTTVLVVLANFDDDLGVQGLADAFPNLRMFWAAAFAVCFVVCR